MLRKFFCPLIKLIRERIKLSQGQLVAGFGGIEVIQSLGQDFGDTEQGKGA